MPKPKCDICAAHPGEECCDGYKAKTCRTCKCPCGHHGHTVTKAKDYYTLTPGRVKHLIGLTIKDIEVNSFHNEHLGQNSHDVQAIYLSDGTVLTTYVVETGDDYATEFSVRRP